MRIVFGSTRYVLLVGRFALKIGRGRRGRLCNLREFERWTEASPARREMLCPTLSVWCGGMIAIQPRAAAMTEAEAQRRRDEFDFPSWDYRPGEAHGDPTEPKASDWGYLSGKPVALDYGMPDEDC